MTTTGLNHINLHAPRELLEALKDFYCEIVGLHVGARPSFRSFGYWLYAGDKPIVHLSETDPDEVRRTDIATAFDHVAFECTDRAEVEAKLRRRGLAFRTAPVPGQRRTQFFLKDPAGNGVELNVADANS